VPSKVAYPPGVTFICFPLVWTIAYMFATCAKLQV
jgi:hypothetical protein